MKIKKAQLNLTTDPIGPLIRKISLPIMLGLFFNTMFNVVDSFYAGGISTDALAGMSVTFPLFLVLISFSHGFSSGPNALIAFSLGKKDFDSARRYLIQTILFGIFGSFMLTFFGIFFSETILSLIGVEGEVLENAMLFIIPTFSFCSFQILFPLCNTGLAAKGNNKVMRDSLIFTFFLNLLLDPWFIYGGYGLPAMGLAGVAYATAVAQASTLAYVLFRLFGENCFTGLKLREFKPHWPTQFEILRQGSPPAANLLIICAFFFLINGFLARYGKEAIAAYGIGLRIEQLVLVPAIGINSAIMTLLAQNYGAANSDRMMEVRNKGILFTLGFLIIGALVVWIIRPWLIDMFTEDPRVHDIGLAYLNVASLLMPAYGLIHITNAILQGVKRPQFTLVAAVFRQLILPPIVFSIAVFLFAADEYQIWWCILITNWIMAIAMYFVAEKILGNVITGMKAV